MHHTCIKIRRETALGKKERKKERKKKKRERKEKKKKERVLGHKIGTFI